MVIYCLSPVSGTANRAVHNREHSSAGRASALQAEGHRFEPCCSHHCGLVVQLVRTLACHARGRGFEPHPGRHFFCFGQIAQSVEQRTENPRVGGSIPSLTTNAGIAQLIERRLAKAKVTGLGPASRSIRINPVRVDFFVNKIFDKYGIIKTSNL